MFTACHCSDGPAAIERRHEWQSDGAKEEIGGGVRAASSSRCDDGEPLRVTEGRSTPASSRHRLPCVRLRQSLLSLMPLARSTRPTRATDQRTGKVLAQRRQSSEHGMEPSADGESEIPREMCKTFPQLFWIPGYERHVEHMASLTGETVAVATRVLHERNRPARPSCGRSAEKTKVERFDGSMATLVTPLVAGKGRAPVRNAHPPPQYIRPAAECPSPDWRRPASRRRDRQ
jgi:hypothetical protein